MPKVSFCIPTLDNYDKLHITLKSIKETCSHIDYEVVIIDNGSAPRGYVRPQNRALEAAEGDILCAINDDVRVTPGWIDPLIAEIEKGTWIAYPDQESTDGLQKICGWCIFFSREGLIKLDGFNEYFTLWCGDIDLVKRAVALGHPPIRVAIPTPLEHLEGGTQTIGNQEYRDYMNPTGMLDIQRYMRLYGEDPNQYKHIPEGKDKWEWWEEN